MHKPSVLLAILCCLSLSAFAEHPHALHHPAPGADSAPQPAAPLQHEAQQPPIHIISNHPPSTPLNTEGPAIKPPQPEGPAPNTAAAPTSPPTQTAEQPSPVTENPPVQSAEQKTASTPEESKTTTPLLNSWRDLDLSPTWHLKIRWAKALKDLFN